MVGTFVEYSICKTGKLSLFLLTCIFLCVDTATDTQLDTQKEAIVPLEILNNLEGKEHIVHSICTLFLFISHLLPI